MTLANNFKKARLAKGLSMRELAERASMSKSSISKIENGQTDSIRPENRIKLANALEIDPNALFNTDTTDDLSRFDNVTPANDETTSMIPVIGKIACGEPIFSEENILGYVPTPRENLPAGENFWLDSVGDSMTPTIPEGAQVLIHKQPEVEDGEVAAVCVDDEMTLKRVKHVNGAVLLLPDNAKYSPIVLNEQSRAYIVGKAIKYGGNL